MSRTLIAIYIIYRHPTLIVFSSAHAQVFEVGLAEENFSIMLLRTVKVTVNVICGEEVSRHLIFTFLKVQIMEKFDILEGGYTGSQCSRHSVSLRVA